MTLVPRLLRAVVVARAGSRYEYCGLAQEGQEATFHVAHATVDARLIVRSCASVE